MIEEEAEYGLGIKAILALPIAVIVALLLLTLQEEKEAILILFITLCLMIAVYWLILPRRFRVLDDSLEIVLGFTYRIPFSEIREVKKGSGKELIFFKGFKFATSKNVIVVLKKKGFGITISPKNADLFLERLRASLEAFKRRSGRTLQKFY
ncbi:MAG: PH domain-containing protein [Archaeoglobaceae archaeon]